MKCVGVVHQLLVFYGNTIGPCDGSQRHKREENNSQKKCFDNTILIVLAFERTKPISPELKASFSPRFAGAAERA